jgi:hypothetical protein
MLDWDATTTIDIFNECMIEKEYSIGKRFFSCFGSHHSWQYSIAVRFTAYELKPFKIDVFIAGMNVDLWSTELPHNQRASVPRLPVNQKTTKTTTTPTVTDVSTQSSIATTDTVDVSTPVESTLSQTMPTPTTSNILATSTTKNDYHND